MPFDRATLAQQASALDTELGMARYSARSADGIGTAVVSGQGQLIDLVIADDAIRNAHPHTIGPAVRDAVSAARQRASAVSLAKLNAVLDKNQEWQPESSVPPVTEQSPRRAARHSEPVDDDESFDELNFITDHGHGSERRGRW